MRRLGVVWLALCGVLLLPGAFAQQSGAGQSIELNNAARDFVDSWAQGNASRAASYLSANAVGSGCLLHLVGHGSQGLSHREMTMGFRQYLQKAYVGHLNTPLAMPVRIAAAEINSNGASVIDHLPAINGDYQLVSLQGQSASEVFACRADAKWLADAAATQPLFGQFFYFANGADRPQAYAAVWHQSGQRWKILAFGPLAKQH